MRHLVRCRSAASQPARPLFTTLAHGLATLPVMPAAPGAEIRLRQ